MPVAGELPVVAPDLTQVKVVTPQLSLVVGLFVATLALHEPASAATVTFDGQAIVGF